MIKKKVLPRTTPDRDSKYMGLAWIHAGFSKDPSTQVGAQLVSEDNFPLGSGYNGPPRIIRDDSFSWDRPTKENPEGFSKYDVMVHAEINAIDHSLGSSLTEATLYVTALPCPKCMLDIVRAEIGRVVYMDYQSSSNSSLQNGPWRDKSMEIARLANLKVELFKGSIHWMVDWMEHLKELGVFEMTSNT